MSAGPDRPETLSPAELQEVVRIFADSDLQELRLSVDGIDLLLSRNEHVEPSDRASTPSPSPVRQAGVPAAAPGSPARAPWRPPGTAEQATGPAEPSTDARTGLVEVRSPSVGTFYRRPAPDQAPFIEVGSEVSAGDPVGTIEVMKMFTTVTAETDGTVTEICVRDASLVEHGQVLLYLEGTSA